MMTVGTAAEIGVKEIEVLRCKNAASYLSSLPRGGSPDERFKETPRPFPIKSNQKCNF